MVSLVQNNCIALVRLLYQVSSVVRHCTFLDKAVKYSVSQSKYMKIEFVTIKPTLLFAIEQTFLLSLQFLRALCIEIESSVFCSLGHVKLQRASKYTGMVFNTILHNII